jgi:hypothetical protein
VDGAKTLHHRQDVNEIPNEQSHASGYERGAAASRRCPVPSPVLPVHTERRLCFGVASNKQAV